jgi:ferredoxin
VHCSPFFAPGNCRQFRCLSCAVCVKNEQCPLEIPLRFPCDVLPLNYLAPRGQLLGQRYQGIGDR